MAISVADLASYELTDLELTLVAGEDGRERIIEVPRIQKPGLALTGYSEQLHLGRLLTLGGTEIEYLASVSEEERTCAYSTVMAAQPACIVVTRSLSVPEELIAACKSASVCVFSTSLESAEFIGRVTQVLERELAPTISVHGVLVDVLEVGILLLGKSGIGKSEAALDLVSRGHRLVGDDIVETRLRADGTIVGCSAKTLGHHMEIRGLGIINIADLFGITAIRDSKRIELVIELDAWRADAEYDRLGIDEKHYDLLGVNIPLVTLPVRPGRNIAMLIEVAARNRLLTEVGHHSARSLISALDERLARARAMVAE